jgi:hypothetical protein
MLSICGTRSTTALSDQFVVQVPCGPYQWTRCCLSIHGQRMYRACRGRSTESALNGVHISSTDDGDSGLPLCERHVLESQSQVVARPDWPSACTVTSFLQLQPLGHFRARWRLGSPTDSKLRHLAHGIGWCLLLLRRPRRALGNCILLGGQDLVPHQICYRWLEHAGWRWLLSAHLLPTQSHNSP